MGIGGVWLRFKQWVQTLFGVKPEVSNEALDAAERDARRYFDITQENITAIVSNALSTLAFGDGTVTISAKDEKQIDSDRVNMLSEVCENEFNKAKRTVSAGLGVGMVATIPYSVDNGLGRKIYTSTVTKDRFFITGVQGTDVTQCVIIADAYQSENDTFFRWTEYSVDGGVYTIRNKATREGVEIPLEDVPRWANIEPEIKISGVNKLPIGIFRCPAANRRPDDICGVPITFGCEATLGKITNTLKQIETEYEKKKVKLFADRSLLKTQYDENGKPISNTFDDDLYVRFGNSDSFTTQVFDPAIRDSAYYTKLMNHFAFLEKEIGVSRGILTDTESRNATATEIRRAMYNTFCVLDDIHGEYERYIKDVLYGCNVLMNFYGLAQEVPYKVNFDWSYALLEDTQATFAQKVQAASVGAERIAEIRMFLHPEETADEAQAVVDDIKKQSLIANELLGGTANDLDAED